MLKKKITSEEKSKQSRLPDHVREFLRLINKLYNKRIVLGAFGLWMILLILPEGFVADHLNLRRALENGSFTRVIQSFITAFGFLVTVLVLCYGFLRDRFRRLALGEFLDNSYTIVLISSFISIFIFNILSSIYIDSHGFSHTSLNFAYFSLSLSIAYFIIFLPLAFYSIWYADSQVSIQKYTERLQLSNFPKYPYNEITIEPDEHNPLNVLVNLSRIFVDKEDYHSAKALIFLVQQKIESLIGNSHDRVMIGSLFTGQKLIWESIINKAIQKKEYVLVERVFTMVRLYHFHFSQKKIPLLYLEELTFYTENLLERMIKEGSGSTVEQILIDFEKILEDHYDNSSPKEDQLWDLMDYYGQNPPARDPVTNWNQLDAVELQWQKIVHTIPNVFSLTLTNSMQTKNLTVFRRALGSVSHLLMVVMNSKMGQFQKAWILRDLLGVLHVHQIEGLTKGFVTETYNIEWVRSHQMKIMVEEDLFCKKQVLESTSEFFIELSNIGKLDKEVLNVLSSLGRMCASNYSLQSCKNTLSYILRFFKHLQTELEKDKSQNLELYIFLRESISSFVKFHQKPLTGLWKKVGENMQTNIDNALIESLEKILQTFSNDQLDQRVVRINWTE
jgi:hypothetical protein